MVMWLNEAYTFDLILDLPKLEHVITCIYLIIYLRPGKLEKKGLYHWARH